MDMLEESFCQVTRNNHDNTNSRQTMLHYAIDQNDWVTLSQLIDSGYSVNTQGDKSFTPIHHAIMRRDIPSECFLHFSS